MKMKTMLLGIALATASFCSASHAADISLEHAWSRETPPSASVGAGYVLIKNSGQSADRLLSATADVAGKVEIHQMVMDNNVMQMRPIDSLTIPPGQEVELKPGGFHVMFMEIKRPLKGGDTIKGALTFEKAGTIPVEFKVETMGSGMPSSSGGHEHH